jgi:aspartate-semialdehyde dehydrogenase
MAAAEAKAQYSAIVLGATGNVGRRIMQLLIKNPLCKKVVVVTRRKTDADPKISEVVVNMDRLEEEVAPHAQGVDVALAAFGSATAARKCPRRRCARSKLPTHRPFAAPPRPEGLVCAGS